MSEISTTDDELEALMAELEAQNAAIMGAKTAESSPEPAPAPAAAPEPTPEPAAAVATADEDAEIERLAAELEAEPADAKPAVEVVPPWEGKDEREAYVPLPEGKTIPVTLGKPVEPANEMATLDTGTPMYPPEPEKPAPTEVTTKMAEAARAAMAERRVTVNEDGSFNKPTFGQGEQKQPTTDPAALAHYVDVDQFRADTRVTETNLDQCMIEQSGLRAFYAAQAARAEAQAARVKAKFEVVEATLYNEHRKILAAEGEKTTEKMVENAVKIDRRWIKAKNLVIEADTIAAINKGLVESLKDRRDMIIQLGADRRDEYKGAARVLAEQSERESLRDRALSAAQRG